MSDEHGPVHYQVSITGAQAGGFFFALLVALGLAFFFGMKTGAAAKKAPAPAARLAAASDIAVPAVPTPESGEDTKVTTSRPPEPEPTLGIEEKPVRAAETSAPGGEAEAKPPQPKAVKTAVAAPAAKPTAPLPSDTSAAIAAKEPTASWYVQVAALQNAAKADETVKKLRGAGYASDVSEVPGKAGLIRVRVGPYGSRGEAEAAAEKIQKTEKLKTRPSVVAPGQ